MSVSHCAVCSRGSRSRWAPRRSASGEWQTSISSYYYTPAGPVFTAVLCALGVCLVVLRGYTDAEDTALNLAGLSAPMVGFVPTPEMGADRQGRHRQQRLELSGGDGDRLGGRADLRAPQARRRRRVALALGAIGLVSVAGAWVVGVGWLLIDQESFATKAHGLAAMFTFTPFALAVVLNTDWGVRKIAKEAEKARTRLDKTYWALVVAMVGLLAPARARTAGWTTGCWRPRSRCWPASRSSGSSRASTCSTRSATRSPRVRSA